MIRISTLIVAAIGLCLGGAVSFRAQAQQEGAQPLEEVVVTARKREENLQDVPVSISVMSSDLLSAAGIRDQSDLFEMTPGLEFDTVNGDRNSGNPSIRGIQSQEIATTRQKSTSFLDGMPLIGQTASLQFVDVSRVEIFRGPQSAAFGRSTFAGAINYVSRDPTEDFEGRLSLDTSSLGNREAILSLGGPIGDKVGYTLDMKKSSFDGPDDWTSSDGYRLGSTATDYISGKLKLTPSDRFDAEFRVMSLRTDDSASANFLVPAAGCGNYPFVNNNGRPQTYFNGDFNCDVTPPSGGIPRNHDVTTRADGSKVVDDPLTPWNEADIALSYAVEPMAETKRDRYQTELNFDVGKGSVLQLLGFHSTEHYQRWNDFDNSATDIIIGGGPMGVTVGMNVQSMSDPTDITENYVEVRWVSPGDQPFRYVFGVSNYDYNFLTNVFFQYGAIVHNLSGQGISNRPNFIISEIAKNTGAFASLNYDVTDKTTLSFESRYQTDDIANQNNETGQTFDKTTRTFLPRLALNYAFSDKVSFYAQVAKGNNPGGVNIDFSDPDVIASLRAANVANPGGTVTFDETSFLRYDEETLVNTEVGIKASLLENRLRLASALYHIATKNDIQVFNVNWDGDWNDPASPDFNGTFYAPPFTMARLFLNSGDTRVVGLESEAEYRVNDHFDLRGTLTLANAEYTDRCSLFAVASLGMTPDVLQSSGASAYDCVDVTGNKVINQPDVSTSASVTYRATLPNTEWRWSLRLDWRHVGSNYLDDVNLLSLPSKDTFNLSANFEDRSWSIRAYVRNLTDDDTPALISWGNDYGTDITGNTSGFVITPSRPREAGLTLDYRF